MNNNNGFTTLTCPSCGGKVQVAANTHRYVCEYCGNEHILAGIPLDIRDVGPEERQIIPVPDSIRVQKGIQRLRLTRRWFSWKYVPLALFCVAWDSFLIFWYGIAFSTQAPWIMIVFPIAHLAVGIGLTYSTLAGFINKTVLEITPEEVDIWHEPLIWPGEISISTSDLQQLYCKDCITHGDNSTSVTYELYALLRNGHSKKLLAGLDSSDLALYIEQQIESWLHIPDYPVVGEIR